MRLFLFFIFLSCFSFLTAQTDERFPIIPKPAVLLEGQGTFTIDANTVIIADRKTSKNDLQFFKKMIRKRCGLQLRSSRRKKSRNSIRFITDYDATIPDNGYRLFVTADNITIRGNFAGHFYGIQTLLQMLKSANGKHYMHCATIMDQPAFQWRGMHLDVSRHFFPKKVVKQYLQWMAMYKMNVFHWHLTDDQGWRIEIKKYPRLTSAGAWRTGTLIGHYSEEPDRYDTIRYGGYYTQEDIREIVAYADSLHIMVVPEIEMPGHASAMITAYPQLACTEGPFEVQRTWGVFEDVLCPTEYTFSFLQDVLDEVCKLFPGKFVHIGGDECPKERWKQSAYCQELIRKNNLKDEHGLQSWFVQRIVNYLETKGKKAIGWDEILEGGLAKGAAVMSWRGEEGGIAAAKAGHYAVMTPGGYCYFDHYQSKNPGEPLAIGGFTPLEKVYSYNPVPASLSPDEKKYILGAQGNVWTEYLPDLRSVEYMIFPRMAALSEVCWTNTTMKNYESFLKRMEWHFAYYDTKNIHYARSVYDVKFSAHAAPSGKGILLDVIGPQGCEVRYRLNSDTAFRTFDKTILCDDSKVIYAAAFRNGKQAGSTSMYQYHHHLAAGKNISLQQQPHASYNTGGALTLTDGVTGRKPWNGSEWLGFSGDSLKCTIDLGKDTNVTFVKIFALEDIGSWIYAPKHAPVIEVSNDGKNFKPVIAKPYNSGFVKSDAMVYKMESQHVRYIRIMIPNYGIIPEGKPGAGNKAWLFVSEIMIE
ncbi:MAG: family 20 glycosylhydrolase [Bacteroidia bacterium]